MQAIEAYRENPFLMQMPVGDLHKYGYVANDPVNFVDVNGLWKVSFSLYAGGVGGGFSFGVNPDGRAFVSASAGVGVGGSLSYSPNGKSNNYNCNGNYGKSNGGNSLSAFAQAGAGIGPAGATLGYQVGTETNSTINNQVITPGKGFGIGYNASAGVRLTKVF